MQDITSFLSGVPLPSFARVRQRFSREELSREQIEEKLRCGFAALRPVRPGQRICITCGSRGVANMPLVTRLLVELVRDAGAKPFLVPAMGSHGGASAEGQLQMLRSLGISEESMGCPILSSMETVKLTEIEGLPVYMDRFAAEADGIIVLNRVKMHTSFRGDYESGLLKMLSVGLGKQRGADLVHAGGEDDMARRIRLIGGAALHAAPVVLGVALLENAFEKTFALELLPPDQIEAQEPALLKRAKERMAQIYFPDCDILVVHSIGKNYSGAGADPNIVGRCANPKLKSGVRCKRMAFFDLSDESHGNATGIGRADIVSRRLYEKMEFNETYYNFITCNTPDTFKIPVVLDSDRTVLQGCIQTCVGIDRDRPRILMMDNSLETEYILISEAMLPEAEKIENVEIVSNAFPLVFDAEGTLFTPIKPVLAI
jgi:hypothetical protein